MASEVEKKNRKKFRTPVQVTVLEHGRIVFDRVFDEYPVVIGRSPNCEISFPQYDFISRQHAAIVETNGETLIVDLNSSNAFYFQGKKTKKAPIVEDGAISIGELVFKFSMTETVIADTSVSIEMSIDTDPRVSNNTSKITPAVIKESPVQKLDIVEKPVTVAKPKVEKVASEVKKLPSLNKKPAPSSAHEVLSSPSKSESTLIVAKKTNHKEDKSHQKKGHSRQPMITTDLELLAPHPHAAKLKPNQRVLESYVTWHHDIYDVQQYYPGEKVTLGTGPGTNLNLPIFNRPTDLAFYDGEKTQCFIPQGAELSVQRGNKKLSFEELMSAHALARHNSGYLLKLGEEDFASVGFGADIEVHFRYAPVPRQLARAKMIEPEEEIKKSTLISGIFHIFILAFSLLTAPESKAPKIDNVPERYARLLVEPPKPIIPPKPPEPPPEPPKKIAEEKPKPPKQKPIVKKIVQRKPKVVQLKQNTKVKQVQKISNEVSKTTKVSQVAQPSKPAMDVTTMGPLAALTALSSKPSSSNQPVAININQNAGGPSKMTTSGVLGTLKAAGGKQVAGGMASVQTKGLGVGSGTGYGIQGLKGTAGGRGVAGQVTGVPKLMSIGKDEGLTREQVMAVVKKYLGEINQCYERSLFQNPGLAGKVEYEWEIAGAGGVNWTKVKSTQLSGADALNSCVLAVFKKMKFPVAKNGQTTVPTLPLEFGKL